MDDGVPRIVIDVSTIPGETGEDKMAHFMLTCGFTKDVVRGVLPNAHLPEENAPSH